MAKIPTNNENKQCAAEELWKVMDKLYEVRKPLESRWEDIMNHHRFDPAYKTELNELNKSLEAYHVSIEIIMKQIASLLFETKEA